MRMSERRTINEGRTEVWTHCTGQSEPDQKQKVLRTTPPLRVTTPTSSFPVPHPDALRSSQRG